MTNRIRLLSATLGLLLLGLGRASGEDRILLAVEAGLPAKAALIDARAEFSRAGSSPVLKVTFGHHSSYPNIHFEAARAVFNPDWSGFSMIGLTVENPAREPVQVHVRVDSSAAPEKGRQGGTVLGPGEKKRLVMALGGQSIIGMRGQPPPKGGQPDDVTIEPSPVPLDLSKIARFQVFASKPTADFSILIHRLELLGDVTKRPGAFVDRFGQYNGADWPGKLHDEKEFALRLKAEEADLAQHPSLPGRDQWGGWADGPTLGATGRFYPTNFHGKWWLVDPAGRLFWSSGITCVNFQQGTRTKGREGYFEWLPGPQDPLRQFLAHSGKASSEMNFFQANLFRKYGPDYTSRYPDTAVRRFRSWGITTAANWSDYEGISRCKGVPYTIPVSTGSRLFLAEEHPKAGLVKQKWFPDVFDPEYAKNLEAALVRIAGPYKNDPWLLGVFVDNELHWVGGDPFKNPGEAVRISAIAFKNDGTFAIKKALVQTLENKYQTTAALNRVLGTTFQHWDELLAPVTFTQAQMRQGSAVFAELDGLIAEQYFRTISQTMKRVLPGVLYLGCRFSGYSDEVVRQAARYCDVVSFNIYAYLPEERLADELSAQYHFPVVIGEFHFGALDRGMFDPGLRKAENQSDRAAKYAAYVEQAARGPWCVGAHWFEYVDQPLTGRADGENYNIGFINGTDDPYPEMVAAARKVNGGLYRIRMGP